MHRSHALRSSLYTSVFQSRQPAWMPISSTMDGNLATPQVLE